MPGRLGLRTHFNHRHPRDSICILEEGAGPLPRCELCGLHTTYRHLNTTHPDSRACAEGQRRRRQAVAREDARRAQEQLFYADGLPLDSVCTFKYLGRQISYDDSDWLAVLGNVRKAKAKWAMVSRVLCRQGASPRVSAMFYKAIVQSVLLFGSDSWVLTESMIHLLNAFHHRMARQITGYRARYCRITQEWSAEDIGVVLASAGMFSIVEYISRRRNTIAEYIATRPIFQAASTASRRSGSSSMRKFWWDQSLAR
jgi:hypothetical protein